MSSFFYFLNGKKNGLGQYMGLPNSLRAPPEVHNHEFNGRLVSVVMLLSIHTQCPGFKDKVSGALNSTRVMMLPGES